MRLLLLFIDGLGLGQANADNPLVSTATPGLNAMLEGKRLSAETAGLQGRYASLWALDASLGVPGLPQSATGQATIFTGTNAAAYLGRHLNGFPNQKLRRLLAAKGLFRQLQKAGYKTCFANAYRPRFFELLAQGLPGCRYSCSTLVSYYGKLPFNGINEIDQGQALFMDITNELLVKMGLPLMKIEPEEAAERLYRISGKNDFTLFEFFLTDLAGHSGDQIEVKRVITLLDRFMDRLRILIDGADQLILLTSDHGNLEESAHQRHTMNKVPALLVGPLEPRHALQDKLQSLDDILPAVFDILQWP